MTRRVLLRRSVVIPALLAAAALGACERQIHVVTDRRFNGTATLDQRTQQIIQAVNDRNWRVVSSAPGRMQVRYIYTEHRITLDIVYTETQFSFVYVDSAALRYDGTLVHRAYNEWVTELEQQILSQSAV